jgi:hypothetical protein
MYIILDSIFLKISSNVQWQAVNLLVLLHSIFASSVFPFPIYKLDGEETSYIYYIINNPNACVL